MKSFDKLTDEEKLEKIKRFMGSPSGYPVPAYWVDWLIKEFVEAKS